jgi:adenosine deaminase
LGFRLSENARNNGARWLLCSRTAAHDTRASPVPDTAEDLVVRNLIEALNRIHADLERIEVWTAALACFQEAAPQYEPSCDHLLPPRKPAARSS